MTEGKEFRQEINKGSKGNDFKNKVKNSNKQSKFFTSRIGGFKVELSQIKSAAKDSILPFVSLFCGIARGGIFLIYTSLVAGKHLIQDRQLFFLLLQGRNSKKRFLQKKTTKKIKMEKELQRFSMNFN